MSQIDSLNFAAVSDDAGVRFVYRRVVASCTTASIDLPHPYETLVSAARWRGYGGEFGGSLRKGTSRIFDPFVRAAWTCDFSPRLQAMGQFATLLNVSWSL